MNCQRENQRERHTEQSLGRETDEEEVVDQPVWLLLDRCRRLHDVRS